MNIFEASEFLNRTLSYFLGGLAKLFVTPLFLRLCHLDELEGIVTNNLEHYFLERTVYCIRDKIEIFSAQIFFVNRNKFQSKFTRDLINK